MSDEGKNQGAQRANLDWDGHSPRSIFFDDIYFAGDGLAEAVHVFLEGNGLGERFAECGRFVIGETGFGTGLNVLAAIDLWQRTPTHPGASLDIISFEQFPLYRDDLARAHEAWPDLRALSARLRDHYPVLTRGVHVLHLADDVTLTLVIGEAGEWLKKIGARVDAWFLDGFAPSRNPEMWRQDVLDGVARLSKEGATFSTFTVAGAVRRGLERAGFALERRAGFGRKREMLTGRLANPAHSKSRAPWFCNDGQTALLPGGRVAIIGGGIAGASLARACRQKGLAPTIFERAGIAAGASGNVAGLIMPRLDLDDTPAARFFLSSYLYCLRVLGSLPEDVFNPCGVTLSAANARDHARFDRLIESHLLPDDMMARARDGLFFPQAGVVAPKAYVAALMGTATPINCPVEKILSDNGSIVIRTANGDHAFDACVIANGWDALRLWQTRSLPLQGKAGQLEWFKEIKPPAHVIAGGPYIAPAPNGGCVVGASYDAADMFTPPHVTSEATTANLDKVQALLDGNGLDDVSAALQAAGPRASTPRVSVRCTTPDRLPVAGPLADWAQFGVDYDDLRLGKPRAYPEGKVQKNLHILTGLGSRGLVTAPLLAEFVVAEMTASPLPLDEEVAEALHPARFFIRDLKRARNVKPSR